ncbi:hypothetical protein QVD17_24947 [Tagetes erecta]|uniref:Uncharacterized protein n=1 Tax=Tagetes erecta TaxID=13708 RepID=A0AAD8KFM9_TARER|nr:hypothetical protein QVD17_24947 [Tagetes erecta]
MEYTRNNRTLVEVNTPCIIKIDGCIGVVCHDRVVESNAMHIWKLQDYENRVWVVVVVDNSGGGQQVVVAGDGGGRAVVVDDGGGGG